ncbi:alpha/beta hydrolase [Hoeflea sp.]|uniref:alpha/beta hydrolase n=1 Tax=Hoeflea sp. TaxID=1940281 RepID=UPI003749F076
MSRPTAISFDFQAETIVGVRYPAPQPTGARVLLNHGFSVTRMGVGRAFVDLARGLTDAGCTVYAFDRLGHGESDGRFLDVTVPNELEQLSAMLDYVQADGDGPIHVLGHSLGGMESACLASRRPDEIASLTLWAAAAVFVDDINSNQIQGQSLDPLYETGVFDFDGQALGLGFVKTGKDFEPFAGLEAFGGKVWLHQGEADNVVPMKYAETYAKIWSSTATLYRYPEADHGWNRLADRTLLLQRTVADIAGWGAAADA